MKNKALIQNIIRKICCIGVFTLIHMLIISSQMTASAFGGGGGRRQREHENEGVGSTTRNNIISFENAKVEEGIPLTVTGAPEGSSYQWTIQSADGTENKFNTTENTYTPTKADKEKLIKVSVEGLEGSEAAIYFSDLPVVYINNSTGYYAVSDEYTEAAISMQGNAAYLLEDQFFQGVIDIRLRGNSTKWREKKPFNIKLSSKSDLLGMGKSKHWALLANDIDHTLMRNKLLYDFSGAIGMDTYTQSESIILIFNNQYYGVYQLCELVNIEEERVNIFDWEECAENAAEAIVTAMVEGDSVILGDVDAAMNGLEDALCQDMNWITEPYTFSYDIDDVGSKETYKITDYIELPAATGGVLAEMDFYAFDGSHASTMITAYSQPLYFKTPEYAISNPALFGYIKDYLQAFEYSLHSTDFIYHESDVTYRAVNQQGGNQDLGYELNDFSAAEYDGTHYSELFDMDSLIQNFLVCEFSMNWDSMKNSTFFYKDIDGLFHIGPEWDFDWSLGNINMYQINTWYPESWHTTEEAFTVEQYYQTVQWDRYLIRDPYFLVRAYEKYHAIRQSILEEMIKSGGTIDTLEAYLSDAATANDDKWENTYEQYGSVGFAESIDNMKQFIDIRVDWLDKQFASLNTLISSLGYYEPSSELTVTMVDTETLDDYAEITVTVTDSDIASVAFQVNGCHMGTAEVQQGKAVYRFSKDALVSDENQLNVVQILAKDETNQYIISRQQEGDYANATSNYAVFYNKGGMVSAEELSSVKSSSSEFASTIPADSESDIASETAAIEMSEDVASEKEASRFNMLMILVIGIIGTVLLAAGVVVVVKSRNKTDI